MLVVFPSYFFEFLENLWRKLEETWRFLLFYLSYFDFSQCLLEFFFGVFWVFSAYLLKILKRSSWPPRRLTVNKANFKFSIKGSSLSTLVTKKQLSLPLLSRQSSVTPSHFRMPEHLCEKFAFFFPSTLVKSRLHHSKAVDVTQKLMGNWSGKPNLFLLYET